MNSAVIKYLFLQTIALIFREGYREVHNYRLRWRLRITKYTNALKTAEFTLKDFVIETLMGLVEMDDFEEFRNGQTDPVDELIADNDGQSPRIVRTKTVTRSRYSSLRVRLRSATKRLLRRILLPIIEKHEVQKAKRKNNTRLTTNSSENRYMSEWSP